MKETMRTLNSMQNSPIQDHQEGSELRRTPLRVAVLRLIGCVARTMSLVAERRIRQPTQHVGREMTFADGTTGTVYRETAVNGPLPSSRLSSS